MQIRYNFEEKTHVSAPQLVYFIKDTCVCAYREKLFTHNIAELYFILDGNGHIRLNKQVFQIKQNDIIFINPYVSHGEFIKKGEAFSYYILGISNLKIPDTGAPSPNAPLSLTENSRIAMLLGIIFDELQAQQAGYLNAANNYFNVLITELERAYNKTKISISTNAISPMLEIKDYIDTHCFGNISSKTIAETFNMKLNTLEVKFKKHYKISIQQYILQKLIEEAKSKLKNDTLSVTDIALRTGFNNPSYFSKYFKKLTGMTPTQYRKTQKNKTD